VLASCAPALEGEEEVVTPQEEGATASEEEEVAMPEEEVMAPEEEEVMAPEEEEVMAPEEEQTISTLAPAPKSCRLDVPSFYAGLGLEPVMGNI